MRSRSNHQLPVVVLIALALAACHASPRPSSTLPSPSQGAIVQLRRDLDAMLAAPGLERGYWSVLAKSLETDETLYALNTHKLMMPASATKIVTLAAAAERLGWDFRYETEMLGVGRIESDTLHGDLLVVGSGDPGIVDRDGMASRLFDSWAERLKAAGIRTITGRIIGDDNAFDDESVGFGWSWDDLAEGYAASVSALQYNENRIQLTITPGEAVGAPAHVTIAPRGSSLIVANLLTTSTEKTSSIELRRLAGSSRLQLRGSVPLGSEPSLLGASVENPTLFFVAALREALIDHGIDVRGPAVDIDDLSDAPLRRDGFTLATYHSPPLSTLMMAPFKFSLNLHEETLLKTMGAIAGAPTFKGGCAVVRSTLQQWGVPPGEFILVDGSGLSRYNYVTADALVRTLVHVDHDDKLRGPFASSLPIAGRDGTLSARMKGTAAEGNARAKTGAMANVRTLAGYVKTGDGERVVFAIFANNFEPPSDVITRAIDSIVVRLADFRR